MALTVIIYIALELFALYTNRKKSLSKATHNSLNENVITPFDGDNIDEAIKAIEEGKKVSVPLNKIYEIFKRKKGLGYPVINAKGHIVFYDTKEALNNRSKKFNTTPPSNEEIKKSFTLTDGKLTLNIPADKLHQNIPPAILENGLFNGELLKPDNKNNPSSRQSNNHQEMKQLQKQLDQEKQKRKDIEAQQATILFNEDDPINNLNLQSNNNDFEDNFSNEKTEQQTSQNISNHLSQETNNIPSFEDDLFEDEKYNQEPIKKSTQESDNQTFQNDLQNPSDELPHQFENHNAIFSFDDELHFLQQFNHLSNLSELFLFLLNNNYSKSQNDKAFIFKKNNLLLIEINFFVYAIYQLTSHDTQKYFLEFIYKPNNYINSDSLYQIVDAISNYKPLFLQYNQNHSFVQTIITHQKKFYKPFCLSLMIDELQNDFDEQVINTINQFNNRYQISLMGVNVKNHKDYHNAIKFNKLI